MVIKLVHLGRISDANTHQFAPREKLLLNREDFQAPELENEKPSNQEDHISDKSKNLRSSNYVFWGRGSRLSRRSTRHLSTRKKLYSTAGRPAAGVSLVGLLATLADS